MIKSMTGYGSAKGEFEGAGLTVELKSVNNRYLDVSVRMPRALLAAEEAIKAAVGGETSRGKVDVFVNLDGNGADEAVPVINETLAAEYAAAIAALSEKLGLKNDLGAVALARLPDVLTLQKRERDREALAAAVLATLSLALADYGAMRSREGERLAADISGRLTAMEGMIALVEARSPQTVAEYREKLFQRMSEVLKTADVDSSRILTEAAIYADKVAVDEETVRLRSHIAQMRSMLSGAEPVGRKLDFLIQEMNREANTIGSKCTDSAIARTVIDLKAEIEKIREQVQNIE